jgi:hypothetical protein
VYSEQEVPLVVQKTDMRPARNTVYGVPFLDQKKKNTDASFNKQVPHSIEGSQEFEKTPIRV